MIKRTLAGDAWEMSAIMKDGKLVMVIAKDPHSFSATNITSELAALLHTTHPAPKIDRETK